MEQKLQQIWDTQSLVFCTSCGLSDHVSDATCDHAHALPWNELDNVQRTRVRFQTIQAAKFVRTGVPVRLTVAS